MSWTLKVVMESVTYQFIIVQFQIHPFAFYESRARAFTYSSFPGAPDQQRTLVRPRGRKALLWAPGHVILSRLLASLPRLRGTPRLAASPAPQGQFHSGWPPATLSMCHTPGSQGWSPANSAGMDLSSCSVLLATAALRCGCSWCVCHFMLFGIIFAFH